MSLKARTVVVAVAVCLLAGTAQAADGLLIVSKITMNGTAQTHQTQIESHRLRSESPGVGGGNQVLIFDGTKKVLVTLDPAKKTYTEMTQADADKMGDQVSGAMAQMKEQMKNLPPEARAKLEAAMQGRGAASAPAKIQYKKTGTDTVGKWTCDKYEGFRGDTKVAEVCTVDPKVLGFTANDFAVSKEMAAFFNGVTSQISTQAFSIGSLEVQGYSGIPVRHMMSIAGRQITTEITEVSHQSFPDSVFQVPAGYQKVERFDPLAGRGRGRQ
jgi:Domain of unknown function (DUF4412)